MAKNKDHGSLKVKKKTIKDQMDDSPVKVDLTKEQGEVVDAAPTKVEIKEEPKQTEDAVQEQSTNDSDAVVGKPEDSSDSKEVVEEIRDTEEEKVEEDSIPIVEIGETPEENNNIVIDETSRPAFDLPENVESLVKFMNDTGGTLEDYASIK